MHLLRHQLGDTVEAELPCALYQHHFVVYRVEQTALYKLLGGGIEAHVARRAAVGSTAALGKAIERLPLSHDARPHSHKPFHSALLNKLSHASIEQLVALSALLYIAQYERAVVAAAVGTAADEVESYVERVDVRII